MIDWPARCLAVAALFALTWGQVVALVWLCLAGT